MTLITIYPNAPIYRCLSTDISGDMVAGASYKGAVLNTTDDNKWYVIGDDLKLTEYTIPVTSSGGSSSVDQGTSSQTETNPFHLIHRVLF